LTGVGAHVNHDRHPVPVGGAEDALHLLDVLWIVILDERVPEVQLHAASEVRVFRATRELAERIVLQGIDSTKPDQSIRISRHLFRGPIVVGPHELGVVRHLSRRVAEAVRRRQHDGSLDPRFIQVLHEVRRADRRPVDQGREGRAEQMLMVVDGRLRNGGGWQQRNQQRKSSARHH
jgi:hypothetical protein